MRRSALLVVASFALVLAACGGDDASSSSDGEGAAITGGDSGQTVAVSVGESGPDEMYMRLSQESVAAGSVTFVVTNEGQKEHEFLVIKTDTPAGEIPLLTVPDGEHDFDEEAAGEVIDEIGSVVAGATEELTVTLEPGHYALNCNLEGHYSAGMWADLQVT
jgi:uncharacterized cupredoxin-like copper-binding protein